MENCLKPVHGNSQDSMKKNEIRDKIRKYFINRDCDCLVRPVIQEEKLANVEHLELN